MSGLNRYSSLLRLLSEARSAWTVADMAEALRAPQSAVYRTVHELIRQGFSSPRPRRITGSARLSSSSTG